MGFGAKGLGLANCSIGGEVEFLQHSKRVCGPFVGSWGMCIRHKVRQP